MFDAGQHAPPFARLCHRSPPFAILPVEQAQGGTGAKAHDAEKVMRLIGVQADGLP
ncbi:hypothetical protein GCM10007315_18920 [Gemmobacter tilapiae]|uniref:Uncharacterized protein n=1 Tax=Neogemmobacter tilapiae TaxID=875041 RepID=A0A918TQ30_9RHOB|nr:hypothetical protein GCM10007315_18920 [Gemmobacter tilapiae]